MTEISQAITAGHNICMMYLDESRVDEGGLHGKDLAGHVPDRAGRGRHEPLVENVAGEGEHALQPLSGCRGRWKRMGLRQGRRVAACLSRLDTYVSVDVRRAACNAAVRIKILNARKYIRKNCLLPLPRCGRNPSRHQPCGRRSLQGDRRTGHRARRTWWATELGCPPRCRGHAGGCRSS